MLKFINTWRKRKRSNGISLYLHIGMPKTGSTAIQRFLDHNREILRQRLGILYPECGVPEYQHSALVKSMVSEKYSWTLFNKRIDVFDPEAYMKNVKKQCDEWNCSKLILSSEFFWASPAMQSDLPYHQVNEDNFRFIELFIQQCRTLFNDFRRIYIIVYLRRQDHWINSFFNQQIKDGFEIPTKNKISEVKNYLLYYRNLKIWAKYFGEKNIFVRTYKNGEDQDVVDDFYKIIGVDKNILRRLEHTKYTTNPRLSPFSTEIMKKAIAANLEEDTKLLLKEVLQEISFQSMGGTEHNTEGLFENEFYRKILELYQEDNQNLVKFYPETSDIFDYKSYDSEIGKSSSTNSNQNNVEKIIDRLLCLILEKYNFRN